MGGPQLGELEAGLVASLFASAAVGRDHLRRLRGLLTVVAVGVVAGAPVVRDYKPGAV